MIYFSAQQLEDFSKDELIKVILDLQDGYREMKKELKGEKKNKLGIKANRVAGKKKGSRKRRNLKGYGRKKEKANQKVSIDAKECPDCHEQVNPEGKTYYSRQVIDLPLISYWVTQFNFRRGWCGNCQKMVHPDADLSEYVLGQSRLGINMTCLIVVLEEEEDMPIKKIQRLFKTIWGLRISVGEIINCKHEVAKIFKGEYEKIKQEIRETIHCHADETGWREDGINGYIWEFVSQLAMLIAIRKSRSAEVPKSILGSKPKGVLSADFYKGYNPINCPKQRCWVHLLRDVEKLVKKYPQDEKVIKFHQRMQKFYCQISKGNHSKKNLVKLKWAQNEILDIILTYAESSRCHRLINRMITYGDELFTFLKYDGIPSSHNNEAERRIRPLVVQRKISYQTRSELGSRIKEILASIVGTARLRDQNLFNVLQTRLKEAPDDFQEIRLSRPKLAYDYIPPPTA